MVLGNSTTTASLAGCGCPTHIIHSTVSILQKAGCCLGRLLSQASQASNTRRASVSRRNQDVDLDLARVATMTIHSTHGWLVWRAAALVAVLFGLVACCVAQPGAQWQAGACSPGTYQNSTCTLKAEVLQRFASSDPTACCTACAANRECFTWTVNTRDSPHKCYLKGVLTGPTTHGAWCTTGTKARKTTSTPAPYPTPKGAKNASPHDQIAFVATTAAAAYPHCCCLSARDPQDSPRQTRVYFCRHAVDSLGASLCASAAVGSIPASGRHATIHRYGACQMRW